MPIKHLTINNVGPFAGEHHFDLPAVAIIQGGNGVGKTGLTEAINYIGERGHDPDMIHGNAEIGEVTVTMADGYQMRARITRDETQRAWKPPEGRKWIVNRSYIDEICVALAYDPMRFLDMEPREQSAELLRLAPVPECPEEIQEAAGDTISGLGLTGNPLDVIDHLIDPGSGVLYTERTQLNVSADSLEKHAAELQRTLLDVPEEGWPDHLKQLQSQKTAAEQRQRDEIAAVNAGFQEQKQAAETERSDAYGRANSEYERELKRIEAVRLAAREAADAVCASAVEAARKSGQAAAEAIREKTKVPIETLAASITHAEANAKRESEAAGTRASIDRAKQDAAGKRERWKALDGAITRLRALRLSLAERLPIKGVMVRDGRIVREQDGGFIPLKKWNTADQRKLALKIGMMVGQKAGFVVLDHLESFDGTQRASLLATCKKYAEENGIQFILASVDAYTQKPGPMRVVDGGK